MGGRPLEGQFADLVVHHHQLKDAQQPLVALLLAVGAAAALHERGPLHHLGRDAGRLEFGVERLVRLLALRAVHADEPLGQHRDHAGGHEVGRHAHVDHPRHGAGGVVGVERAEHKMARERRLDAHLGGFGVAHLPHQDHVGGLPQHGSDDPREIEADLVLDLHLVDAGEVILDRIFGGDDLGVGAVELVERGVERGRLARTRGTGDEDDAVGAANQVFELPEIVFGEPQLPDADLDVVFVEDPHHDRLAVVGGQDADAEIVVFAVGGELDPAVLRAAALGDVELGENLDAGEHRPQQAAGRVVALYQTAVDAVADADPVFEGLDVDVARPQLHRLGDDQINELHHRGIGVVFLGRGGLLLDCRLGEVDGGVCELLEHRVGALAVGEAVVAVDRLDDLLADGERHLDLAIEDKPQLLLRVHVGGIAGGNAEDAV